MALVTFSSLNYKDKTVYAVAGSHTETILKIAKANKIPVPFDCGDGECGSCAVRVTSVDRKPVRMGEDMTEKEKKLLLEIGKITNADLERTIVDDIPTEWRLACQMIVRDEDILVQY